MRRGFIFALACLLYSGASVAAQAISFKRDTDAGGLAGSSGMAVLMLSLLAIGAVVFVRKRLKLGTHAAGRPVLLRVLETRRLGPRSMLSVVEFGGKRHLIAQSEHGISCIDTVILPPSPTGLEGGDAY